MKCIVNSNPRKQKESEGREHSLLNERKSSKLLVIHIQKSSVVEERNGHIQNKKSAIPSGILNIVSYHRPSDTYEMIPVLPMSGIKPKTTPIKTATTCFTAATTSSSSSCGWIDPQSLENLDTERREARTLLHSALDWSAFCHFEGATVGVGVGVALGMKAAITKLCYVP